MVSELTVAANGYPPGLAALGFAPSTGPDVSPVVPAVQGQRSGLAEEQETVSINSTAESFAALADDKETAAQVAKSIRDAGKSLDQAENLLNGMASLVGAVKNYPPFPAGNEERMQYINSIDGLRKEMQSLVVPPVTSEFEPVFYPRESEFPPLDAKAPSDAAVLAFGEAVQAVRNDVDTAREALEAQAQRSAENASAGLPRFSDERQAQEISVAVAGQLNGKAQPLVGASDVFAQL
ncbi:MAG: hypothetical protein ACAH09_10930 [Methylophilaceae bacterium]|jgi:hypothetical protein|nr:hypothetical protein [Methylophilaceae bacterium]